ncbi:E3 ubiquitin-protein ligase RNF4-like [Lolium rigidum]|uniref:E3 ubiquitin-protein ligase RNF4-like n=1 Tax=Lolium rigidum TaxID=89674 RepID=UPI001F5D3A67|nr:E3 ubiquitin-protein ligase RNF4-like [Lolium rigidum]XP_047049006.1 E3 ubiquitin-protein ligase RNF4-like [Lolium rigidum]
MSTVNGVRRVCRRHSQDESADKVVVNLVSPAPGVASRRGVSTTHSGARTSPIDVEALDDEVQVVSASQVPPRRRNPKIRRQPVTVVDLEVHATREGNKRQKASAVINISPETGEGSSLQSNKAVKTRKEPAKVAPKEPIFTCPVCWNKLEEPATTMCGHIFCTSCIKQAIQVQKKCPTCRKYLKINNFHRIYLPNTAG